MPVALSAIRAVAALALVLAALAAPPTLAAAKPGYRVLPGWRAVSISAVAGTNGYRVEVGAVGRRVELSATGPGGTVTYAVRGRSDGRRLEARFGGLGQVSLRMRPLAPPAKIEGSRYGCRGRESTQQLVRFSGTIRFRGERGFTAARSSGGRGTVHRGHRLVCKRPPRDSVDPESSLRVEGMVAERDRGARLKFVADRLRLLDIASLDGPPEFSASLRERRGRVSIHRYVGTAGDDADFTLSPKGVAPVAATVEPPAPFSGTATLSGRAGGPARWRGDLSVELPGRGELRLAGPSFDVRLCRAAPIRCLS